MSPTIRANEEPNPLLSQHANHAGRPSHYQPSQSPAKPHIPWRNSARIFFVNCKARKTLFGFRRNKTSLGVSVPLNTEVCTGPACSFVARKNKMPLKKVARSWSVHSPGGLMLLMRFSDLMSTSLLLETILGKALFLNKMHSWNRAGKVHLLTWLSQQQAFLAKCQKLLQKQNFYL